MGDYVPYYIALPQIVSTLRPGAFLGYAVERRSTPSRALEKLARELGLVPLSETVLAIPHGKLEEQIYHFFVGRFAGPWRGTPVDLISERGFSSILTRRSTATSEEERAAMARASGGYH